LSKYWRPDIALLIGALLVSAAIFAINAVVLDNLREDTLRSIEANMKSQAVALAEEGNRSFEALEMALSIVADHVGRLGFSNPEDLQRGLASAEVHALLKEKAAGVSHVGAIGLIGPQGKLANLSRSFPTNDVDLSDRDYFRALKADPRLRVFVSQPVQNRGSGSWTIILARRLNAPNGDFSGVVFGGFTLDHLERFFQSVSLQDGAAIALVRQDGMLLARHPRSDQVGKIIPLAADMTRAKLDKARHVQSPVDRQLRIVSARPFASYPLVLAVSQTEESALRSWRTLADHSTSMALVRTMFVLLIAWAACRWWQRQQSLTEALSVQNVRFDTALANLGTGLCMFDADKRLLVCNQRYADLYRLPPELLKPGTQHGAIIAHRVLHGVLEGDTNRSAVQNKLSALAALPTDTAASRLDELADGRLICVTRHPMAGGGWVATHEDVTERERLNADLAQNNSLLAERTSHLQAIVDNFPGGIGLFDRDLRLLVCNQRAKTLLDLPAHLFSDGHPRLEDLLRFNAGRGEYGPGDAEEQVAQRLALAADRQPYEFQRERPNGTVLDVRGVPLHDGSFLTTYMDITERHRSEAKIAFMARHDALTGLPNRVVLRERLDQVINGARDGGGQFAVHVLDLDRFKEVNDALGHPIGDALLKAVARRLRACVRDSDTLARLGGDELCIIQAVADPTADPAALAKRVIEVLSEPFDLQEHHVTVGVSIGIAVTPADGSDADTLIRSADLALYRAKSDGRGRFCFFEHEMDLRMQTRRILERDLRNALIANEFELHYQPLFSLEREAICGCEALLRWNHRTRGMLSPGDFIPLVEETGLIIPIGEWVLRRACAEAATWPHDIKVAVNLSPAQFKCKTLVEAIVAALAASGLNPQRLELEITETVMLEDTDGAFATLQRLRNLGVRIALDDFGTGYSSLSNLRKFSFDKIKIDRSFVGDLGQADVDALAVVRSMVQLGASLGIATTAEGVETREQLDQLRAEGCTEIQGHYFSPARSASEIAKLLRRREARAA
jgi:diguanylate cyclase (GGDEF)-like protein